jgi:hypothetical protein
MTYSSEHPASDENPAPADEHAIDLDATPARQGRLGRPVFWVLVGSTSLAVVALFAAWVFQSDKLRSVQNNERPTAAQLQHYSSAAPVPTRAPAHQAGG